MAIGNDEKTSSRLQTLVSPSLSECAVNVIVGFGRGGSVDELQPRFSLHTLLLSSLALAVKSIRDFTTRS